MGKFSLLAVIAVTLLAGPAAVAKEKAKDAPQEKKICKATTTTKSRIPAKRVCRTEAEWARSSSQEDLVDIEAKLRGMSRGN